MIDIPVIPVKDFEIYENGVKIGMTRSVMLFECGQVVIIRPVEPDTVLMDEDEVKAAVLL